MSVDKRKKTVNFEWLYHKAFMHPTKTKCQYTPQLKHHLKLCWYLKVNETDN